MRLLMDLLAWRETPTLLNKALKRFLKLNQRSNHALFKQKP
ncbi:hypothetical protein ACR9KZ_07660 [Helicobacter pylori]